MKEKMKKVKANTCLFYTLQKVRQYTNHNGN